MKTLFALTMVAIWLSPAFAYADHNMEVYGSFHHWSTINSSGNGHTVRLKGDVMRGMGVGIPLNQQWTVNGEFLFGDPGTTVSPGSNATADMMMFDLNLDYKIRQADWSGGCLSPYLTAGLGTMNFNQDTSGGIDEWDLTYNAGVGLYWDMHSNVFLKLAYRWVWVDMDITNSLELFDGVSLAIGLSF